MTKKVRVTLLVAPSQLKQLQNDKVPHLVVERAGVKSIQRVESWANINIVTSRLVDNQLTCECGSTQFEFHENSLSVRDVDSAIRDGILYVGGESQEWDGDGMPGIVCNGCQGEVVLPSDVTIDFA